MKKSTRVLISALFAAALSLAVQPFIRNPTLKSLAGGAIVFVAIMGGNYIGRSR